MMDEKLKLLKEAPIGGLLVRYAIPSIVSMMVLALYMIVDRIFIGNIEGIGTSALSALGATLPIGNVMMAFSALVAFGVATNVSIKLGQKKKDEAEYLLGNAIVLSVIVSLVLMTCGLIFADRILQLFGAAEESLHYAKTYLSIILYGTVFGSLSMTLSATVRVDGSPLTATMIMLTGCILNVFLDWLFIFPFGWGIAGAAWATVISQAVSVILGFSYHASKKANLKIQKAHFNLKRAHMKAILALGMTPFITHVCISATQIANNIILKNHGGELAIGAMAIISSVVSFVLMPIFGMTQALQPIAGFNYGAKQYDRTKKAFTLCVSAGILFMTAAVSLVWIFPTEITFMFNKNMELSSIAEKGMRIWLILMPLSVFNIMATTFIMSIGKAKEAMFLSISRLVMFNIPFALLLSHFLGIEGVWMAEPASTVIAAVIVSYILLKQIGKMPSTVQA